MISMVPSKGAGQNIYYSRYHFAEADDSVLIVYEATYESLQDIRLARPLHSFLEMIETPTGEQTQRFTRIP